MIKAMHPYALNTSVFMERFKPTIAESDFDLLEIPQREQCSSHVDQFSGTISRRLSENPLTPALETVLTIRVIPENGKNKEKELVRRLNAGLEIPDGLIKESFICDGGHRWKRAERDLKHGLDYKLMFVIIVCDDDDEGEIFYNVNGPARRMAPSVVDLALAKKFRNNTVDESKRSRAISALTTWHFSNFDGHPYSGWIEQPFKHPPVEKGTHARLRFHRTTMSMMNISVHLNKSADLSEEQIKRVAKDISTCWKAIAEILEDQIFGVFASYGETQGVDCWVHGHLFGILNETIVTDRVIEAFNAGESGSLKMIQIAQEYESPLKSFFNWGLSEEHVKRLGLNMQRGFSNMSGNSSEIEYKKALMAFYRPHALKLAA